MRSPATQASHIHYGSSRAAHAGSTQARRSGRSLAANIRDLTLIALAWALFIGAMLYPAAQLVGIAGCVVALAAAGLRRVFKVQALAAA